MPKVVFKATPALREWLHKKAEVKRVPYGNSDTVKVIPKVVLKDGDEIEMDGFDANWCITVYPQNFSIRDAKKSRYSI